MTARERQKLIEKKENGLLTEAEHEQYLTLLRTDADFYEEVSLYQLLHDARRQQADNLRWDAFEAALSQMPIQKKKRIVPDWVYRHPAFAMAASIAIFLLVGWGISRLLFDTAPQLVKTETNLLFRADGGTGPKSGLGYAGGDLPIGKLPVKWLKDRKLKTTAAYRYCQDTLTIFVQHTSDTLYLQNNRLRYNSDSRSLSIERPDHSVTLLNECSSTPQPF
jgi:hypothetical protein